MKITSNPVLPPLPPAEYKALRDSIEDRGVLVPLLVTADGVLIDGVERHRACVELGITKYPVRIMGVREESERKELAIRLNAERRHLTALQRRELLAAVIKSSPTKSTRELADLCKVDPRTVGRTRSKLNSGGAIAAPHKIVGRDGRRYPAVGAEHAGIATIAAKLMVELGDEEGGGGTSLRGLRRRIAEKERAEVDRTGDVLIPDDFRVYNVDFRKIGAQIKSGSASLVLGDPPWLQQDFPPELIKSYAQEVFRVLRPGGYLAIYCGHQQLPAWLDSLRDVGLDYFWMVACQNVGMTSSYPKQGILNLWRPLALFRRPGKAYVSPHLLHDVQAGQREKKYHAWQQPLNESVAVVKALSRPGDLVVDLTAGAFTSGTAAAMLGRKYVGCEVKADLCAVGKKRIHDALSERGKVTTVTAKSPESQK